MKLDLTKKYKVAYVAGSRADYGIVRHYLKLLTKDCQVKLSILVTGSLLDETYGYQVRLIEDDGFQIESKIAIPIKTSSNADVLHSMAVALDKFGGFFQTSKYDLLIILGDRYEMMSVSIAAAMQRIPILHLHGGEATYANYDEFIRHSITKMSMYHFTATEEYKQRVIQLGEAPERVFNMGALGAENCCNIDEENVDSSVKQLETKKYFVVLFHPETITDVDVLEQTKELLCALEKFSGYKFVFIGANADTYSDKIRQEVNLFVSEHSNALYYENLHTDAYHYLLKNSMGLIGNSSSGIIEAPSLGIYTVNIGDRQKGRVRGNSVIDVKCETGEICWAIEQILDKCDNANIDNPYYQKNAANNYYIRTMEILEKVSEDKKEPKVFYDYDTSLK